MTPLRSLHRVVGVFTLLGFLASGAYMLFVAHPSELPEGRHLLFLSRHIYILGCALVHLVLGAYVAPLPSRGARAVQTTGSLLLVLASLSLLLAFVVEPVAGRGRTAASTSGLYALFAGGLLHFGASLRAR